MLWQEDHPEAESGAMAVVRQGLKRRTSVRDRGQDRAPVQEGDGRVSRVVQLLRRITLAVQVIPFIYTALYLLLYGLGFQSSGIAPDIINHLCFVSPIVVLAHLVYSRMLKMCRWHRIACALPLFPQAIDLIDNHIYCLAQEEYVVVVTTILVALAVFLVCIYKVFFTDEGRVC